MLNKGEKSAKKQLKHKQYRVKNDIFLPKKSN